MIRLQSIMHQLHPYYLLFQKEEGSCRVCWFVGFSSWRQKIVLDSYAKQIMFTQKKQVGLETINHWQPNRVFSKDDLDFMRRAAESAPSQGKCDGFMWL